MRNRRNKRKLRERREIANFRFEISKRYARPEAMRAFGAGYRERPSAS